MLSSPIVSDAAGCGVEIGCCFEALSFLARRSFGGSMMS